MHIESPLHVVEHRAVRDLRGMILALVVSGLMWAFLLIGVLGFALKIAR